MDSGWLSRAACGLGGSGARQWLWLKPASRGSLPGAVGRGGMTRRRSSGAAAIGRAPLEADREIERRAWKVDGAVEERTDVSERSGRRGPGEGPKASNGKLKSMPCGLEVGAPRGQIGAWWEAMEPHGQTASTAHGEGRTSGMVARDADATRARNLAGDACAPAAQNDKRARAAGLVYKQGWALRRMSVD